jgi:hypothetical protein
LVERSYVTLIVSEQNPSIGGPLKAQVAVKARQRLSLIMKFWMLRFQVA